MVNGNTRNNLTVCKKKKKKDKKTKTKQKQTNKMSSGSFKKVINKMCLQIINILYVCVNRIWHYITNNVCNAINPTNPNERNKRIKKIPYHSPSLQVMFPKRHVQLVQGIMTSFSSTGRKTLPC